MVDTITIISSEISEEDAIIIEGNSILRTAIRLQDDLILYEFTNSDLVGTYDARISIQVKREIWVYDVKYKTPVKKDCNPYIMMRFTIPKILIGHNVYMVNNSLIKLIKKVLYIVGRSYKVHLLKYKWYVKDIHWAENFELDSKEECLKWLENLKMITYSRREYNTYKNECVMFVGTTTTLKIYHKGNEFAKHDKKRLLRWFDKSKLVELQLIANRIIRVEVEIHKRKLKSDFKSDNIYGLPDINDISYDYLRGIYNSEVEKILKGTGDDMMLRNKYDDVRKILFNSYEIGKASALMQFWLVCSDKGDKSAKEYYKRSTYYKYKKDLKDLGITWVNSDIEINREIKETVVFFPVLRSKYRQKGIKVNLSKYKMIS